MKQKVSWSKNEGKGWLRTLGIANSETEWKIYREPGVKYKINQKGIKK